MITHVEAYEDNVENYLIASVDLMENQVEVIFQHDALCHTAQRIREYFEQNYIKTMKLPPNRPKIKKIN